MNVVLNILLIVLPIVILFKIYNILTTAVYKGKERLDEKIAIVTGANTGIGYFCAKDFAKRGAKVIMVCRDLKKADNAKQRILKENPNASVKVKHIDFASLKSVRKCAYELLKEESRIDILLNNAGAVGIGFEMTADGLDILMQSNYFGPFLFTNLLLGTIKKSAPSRIINVSSVVYKYAKVDPFHIKNPKANGIFDLYGKSKLANIYFSNELAKKLDGTGVTSNSLHPGVFYSEIARNIIGSISNYIYSVICSFIFKSTEDGAQTSIFLCVSPKVANISGKYFEECKIKPLTSNANDDQISKDLWKVSEEAVKLKPNEKHY